MCDTLLVDSMFQLTERQTWAAMNFLREGDWRCSFDVFGSDRFNNIGHQEFVDCVTEVRPLCLRELSLTRDFLWEGCVGWYIDVVLSAWNG